MIGRRGHLKRYHHSNFSMAIRFNEFPASYRFSQAGIAFALVALAIAAPLIRVAPQLVKTAVFAMLGVVVLASLVISNYVVIRYPYISLVESEDGDPFSKHFASQGSWLYWVLKLVGLVTPAIIVAGILCAGIDSPAKLVALGYCAILTVFMVFFTFFYDPIRHPTVATFIRSTLGLGIALFPVFGISIAIGSIRCRGLLNTQADKIGQQYVELKPAKPLR
jgi:hypothetical protein